MKEVSDKTQNITVRVYPAQDKEPKTIHLMVRSESKRNHPITVRVKKMDNKSVVLKKATKVRLKTE